MIAFHRRRAEAAVSLALPPAHSAIQQDRLPIPLVPSARGLNGYTGEGDSRPRTFGSSRRACRRADHPLHAARRMHPATCPAECRLKEVAILYLTFRVRCGRFDGSWVSSSRDLVVCPGTWRKVGRYESGRPTRQTPVPWRGFTSMRGGRHMPASCRPGTWMASRTGRGNRGGRRYSRKARPGTTWLRRPAQAKSSGSREEARSGKALRTTGANSTPSTSWTSISEKVSVVVLSKLWPTGLPRTESLRCWCGC